MKIEDLKKYTKNEVKNAERRLSEEAESVARELEYEAKRYRNGGRVYSTDAQNMTGRMNRLYEIQLELDEAQKRLELLNQIGDE
jgi:hypothetical protein